MLPARAAKRPRRSPESASQNGAKRKPKRSQERENKINGASEIAGGTRTSEIPNGSETASPKRSQESIPKTGRNACGIKPA
ncbi:hypothetical protein FIBSPDRAFT_872629 [Athelia psychrophila]|uniref:Uncharacterized protein n=1 Tax=Athelia psychrophila TaxID=1759441 RepID=A0A165ZBT6_9AGAM|nr:hypothetical protein FIBSPDRAFT_872628 [Fibularhizoctonia sp. CBS 109695]KZP10428.1 hypothetical protein FIBSPDRAFT_872629 [Fibularhizoctonia sp. CBS 109695]